MGVSLGGSKSKSKASSDQNIWDPQGQALTGVYDAASDTFDATQASGQIGNEIAPGVAGKMEDVYDLGMGGAESLAGGGSVGGTDDVRAMLMGNMGMPSETGRMYEDIIGGAGNTYIDPMVEAMKTGMMQNLGMMQSGNALDANAMGQGGGSRHAMQNAMSNKQINQDMTQAEMGMRGENYDRDMRWKMDIANRADAGTQANSDRLLEMMGMADTNVGTGIDYAPTAQANAIGEFAPYMLGNEMPWKNVDLFANAVGDPTVLTDQKSKGSSGSFSVGG